MPLPKGYCHRLEKAVAKASLLYVQGTLWHIHVWNVHTCMVSEGGGKIRQGGSLACNGAPRGLKAGRALEQGMIRGLNIIDSAGAEARPGVFPTGSSAPRDPWQVATRGK